MEFQHMKSSAALQTKSIGAGLVTVLVAFLGIVAAACVGPAKSGVHQVALLPNWDVKEMVNQSDTAVVGRITREIGTKRVTPGGAPPEKVGFYQVFKDYEVEVERFLYPETSDTSRIAILTAAGPAPVDPQVMVKSFGGEDLVFEPGDRVMLFLERVRKEVLQVPGHSVPTGFTEQTYYRVIVTTGYGKLVPDGEAWKDTRSGRRVTVSEVEQAAQAKTIP